MEREDYGMSCGIPLSTLDYSTTTDADKNGGHRDEPSLHPRETTNDDRCRQNEAVELRVLERELIGGSRRPSTTTGCRGMPNPCNRQGGRELSYCNSVQLPPIYVGIGTHSE